MKLLARFLLPLVALLAGCASTEVVLLKRPPPGASTEVLVFREWAFNQGGANVRFGAEGKNIVVLGTSEFATVQFAPGTYQLFAQGNTGDPYVAALTLEKGKSRCVRVEPSPGNLGRAFVPFAWHIGHIFRFDERPCPTDEQLKSFKRVPVDYLPE